MRLRVVPCELAAAMGPQMHHRRPAARHRHRVAFDLFENRAFARLRTDRHGGHAFAALDLGNALAILNPDTKRPCRIGQRPAATGRAHQGSPEPQAPPV